MEILIALGMVWLVSSDKWKAPLDRWGGGGGLQNKFFGPLGLSLVYQMKSINKKQRFIG